MKKRSFLHGTIILIIVNFIVRFLGFAYKIVLSRMIGPEGIGLFHLVFPILMTLITFTTAGIPVSVSKLIAHYDSLNNKPYCNRIMGFSLLIGFSISTGFSILLFHNAEFISTCIIKNKDTYFSLLALIPAIPLITLSSIFRGYYYGINKVKPVATSQILEQLFRIFFVIGTLYLCFPVNTKYGAMIATIGISVGEFMGLLWLIFRFKFRKALLPKRTYNFIKRTPKSPIKKILLISLPITISRLITVIMHSINAVWIPQRLQMAGYTAQESINMFGKLAGMAFPLLFLPFIVTSALVVNIIPSISQEIALKNISEIKLKSNLAIRMTLLIAIPTSALFLFFSKPICMFIYNQEDVSYYLTSLALATIFLSLHHTISGILHGMGKQVITTTFHLIGMSIQLLCTYYLVSNPKFGIYGYIYGFLFSSILICILNIITLKYFIKTIDFSLSNSVLKPIIATGLMIISTINIYKICFDQNINNIVSTLISTSIGFIIYVVIIIVSGSIGIKSLQYIFTKK
ncbi:stage V sporulation protein B [Lutibacter sp. B2]|nr:stage V sporulation protein B [Lutibacter sp. B2]